MSTHGLTRNLFAIFFCHWIATLGVAITTASAIVFLGLQFQNFTNPYYSLIIFVAVPALFIGGLSLIPIGLFFRSRQLGGYREVIEMTEWDSARVYRLALLIMAATLINITLLSAATYESLEYLDSDAFCGTVCHVVMAPHFEVHKQSPHAEVGCVECHIGPGPASFVRAKLSGMGRLIGVAFDSYERPVRITDEHRTPVAESCGNCHWRGKPQGDQLRLIRHYADDEQSTPLSTLLMMRIDSAIHQAHVDRDIYYIAADRERQVIPWVSVDGRNYVSGEVPPGPPQKMDCLDCHNRAAHRFDMRAQAVDRAITQGRIDRSIPFARRDVLNALEGGTTSESASDAIRDIEKRNIFPALEITWGTYPDNIGHESGPGCFRCHDWEHATEDGEVIAQDCFGCHEMLAIEEENPEILEQLGLTN